MNRYAQLVNDLKGEPPLSRLEGNSSVLSEEDLSALEAELDHTLPPDYREFLRDYGEYAFDYVECPVFRSEPDDLSAGRIETFDLVEFYTVTTVTSRTSINLSSRYNAYKDIFVPSGVLPIAFAGGSNTYCLILTGEQYGTVSLYIMDDNMLHPIAPSFDEFLHTLVVVED